MLDLFTSAQAPSVVPLFVYGTLRPTGILHRSYFGESLVDSQHAIAPGYGLFTHQGAGWFPYMIRSTYGRAHGDVLWVKRGPDLMRAISMEIGAGYSMELVDVEVDSFIEPLQVAAFTWQGSKDGLVSVYKDDWLAT